MWQLLLPDLALAFSSPFNSALAAQSKFEPMVDIVEDAGRFVISEDEETALKVRKVFRKDAETQYFNLLKEKAKKIGLSQNGLKRLISEHLASVLAEGETDRRRIALTGLTGEIGSSFARYLFKRGYSLDALVREESVDKLGNMFDPADINKIKIENADLFSVGQLRAMISNCDVFYHFAGVVGRDRVKNKEEQAEALAANGFLVGVADEMIKDLKREPAVRFIYPSSYVVEGISARGDVQEWIRFAVEEFDRSIKIKKLNGNVRGGLINFSGKLLTQKPMPKGVNAYTLSKLLGETFALRMKNSVNVRLGSAYGPGCHVHNRIYGLISNRLKNGKKEYLGEALDCVYIDDVIEILAKLARASDPPKEFNLVTGKLTPLKDIISQIEEMTPQCSGSFVSTGSRQEKPVLDNAIGKRLLERDFTPLQVGLPLTVGYYVNKDKPQEVDILKEKDWGQTFIDTTLMRAYEAKKLNQNIIAGLETSMIPEEQVPYVQGLLTELTRLSKEKGLDNILIRQKKGPGLATMIRNLADKTGTPDSNIIFLGDHNVLAKRAFDHFRKGADPEKWAFFAAVELPKNLPSNNYMRILEMLTKAINLWAGKGKPEDTKYLRITQEGKKFYKFIVPESEPMEYNLLEEIYKGQLRTLKST
ncbi:MAG: NAD(P)-dependent oxidoreductase [Candidatus Omnitrophica bacterium]|nr:NAD(P)-dependent oxidoreductase [Candidatus Omnitrophota bacterium]